MAQSLELGLMMQRDTPREGGRREGERGGERRREEERGRREEERGEPGRRSGSSWRLKQLLRVGPTCQRGNLVDGSVSAVCQRPG